jgi:hypothetical protein
VTSRTNNPQETKEKQSKETSSTAVDDQLIAQVTNADRDPELHRMSVQVDSLK